MKYRIGKVTDLDLLANWNEQLIQDSGYRNPMTLHELKKRMANWIAKEYKAVIFESVGEPIAYVLFIESENEIYLRQLFVRRDKRRIGIGRTVVGILRSEMWPTHKRLTLEVLTLNTSAVNFWRSIGFKDYSLKLEIMPPSNG
jgi:ribosomal protein S18 acetylase RimI-like enzyme